MFTWDWKFQQQRPTGENRMSDGDIKDAGQYGFDKEDANKVLEDLKQICRGPANSRRTSETEVWPELAPASDMGEI